MFTSKERSNLRSLAQTEEPIAQIGKGGLNDNMIKSLSEALEARELIKITVLNNASEPVDAFASELSARLNAELVCVIGHKAILYRKSSKKDFKHIKF